MARKLSGGLSGSPSVGALNIAPTAVVTAADNQDITLSPTGTGMLMITANAQLQAQTDLRFADADSSNWVAFQAPATIGSNVTWTLPATDGSDGQFLSTNASGTLSWASGSLSLSDQTVSATTHYPLITTATSGTVTSGNTSSTKFTFQPSTGVVTATGFSGNHSGGTGSFTTLNASSTVGITATTTARQINPEATNTYDLGTASLRWRNIFTQDLQLSNGIGDYTIVEGEEDLFLYNNKNGKVYKFLVAEVNPATATPKGATGF
jgi:hypothetical protein